MKYSQVQNNDKLKKISQKWKVMDFNKIITDNTKNAKKINTEDYLSSGDIPIIDQGQKYIAGYINDKQNAYLNIPAIIFGDHTRVLKYIDIPFYMGADGTKLLTVDKEYAETKYIYYYFKTLNIPNTGYNRHFKFLKEIQIPLPPLEIQKKIADILDKAREVIDKRKEQIEQMDELLKSTFLDMFGDPVSNPKGWDKVELEKVCKFITKGTTPKTNEIYEGYLPEFIPFIKVYHIVKGGIDLSYKPSYITQNTHKKYKRSIVLNGDVLMNIVGPPLGKIGIVNNKKYSEYNINQAIVIYRTIKEFLNNRFLLNTLSYTTMTNFIINLAVGIRQQNLSLKQCRELKIILPPISLQNQFAEIVEKAEAEREKMENSLKEMEQNFDALMQRAFNGELFN